MKIFFNRFGPVSILVTVLLLVGLFFWKGGNQSKNPETRATGPDYSHVQAAWVGRAACIECHAAADSAWTGSDHARSMQLPGPRTITADFNNAIFTHFGVTTKFYRSGEKYMVRTDGPDGSSTDFEIAYVFGFFPLEQFLISFPDGRLQALNICWDTRPTEEGGQRWFHLYPDDETPADDLFHWTGMLQNWNFMCAECHSTNLRRHYDSASNSYSTVWSEINISCEACHGPGSRHIIWERAFARGLNPRDESGSRGLVVDLKSPDKGSWVFEADKSIAVRTEPLASRVEAESCARCHSRRAQLREDYDYGHPFLDHYRLTLLEEFLYHADGQNQDEVYVYGSFLQSKMYAAGVTCGDCHDLHSGRTIGDGNQICAKCHLASTYDTPEHHFHQPGKGGDSCLDCHMQSRKLMVVDGRRDHGFRIPRPDLSLEIGTPNACNDCHDDKTVRWAQDAVVEWYGADRLQGPHYAMALHAGRTGEPGALARLLALVGAKEQPVIARATALSLIPRYGPASEMPEVVQALQHADPLLRGAAVRALSTSPAERQLNLVLPLVDDEILDVRLAVAEILALLPAKMVDPEFAAIIARAGGMWEDYLLANGDRPESQLGLATLKISQGKYDEARECFDAALRIEPRFPAAYVNYSDFLRRNQHSQEAEDLLREGIATIDDSAELKHALGLLMVSGGNLSAALPLLEEAASQREDSARFAYVHAVALHDVGRITRCLTVLEDSLVRHPWDRESLWALASYCLEQGQPARAIDPLERLLKLDPTDAGARNLLAQAREP